MHDQRAVEPGTIRNAGWRLRLLVVVTLAGSLLAVAAPGADAAAQSVVAHSIVGYANPLVVVEAGDPLDFHNADPVSLPHNVTEDGVPADEAAFASATVTGGVTTPVVGVEELEPGAYEFFCSLHPWMKGELAVVEPGTLPVTPPPLAPPSPEEIGDGDAVVALPGGIVPTPTAVHPTDEHLFVASYAQGAVVRLPFLANGVLGAPEVVASGLNNPLGIAVAEDGTIFVADSHAGGAEHGDRTVGRVQAITASGTEIVVDGLPNGRHNTNNLAIHDGRLFITNGNSTDDGVNGGDPELPLSGTLLSVDLATRDLRLGADGQAVAGLTVEATGMRNLYDVAFRPGTDEAWITTNGPDGFTPYGEDTLVRVDDVGSPDGPPDFGFPNCLYRADWDILDNPVTGACGPHTAPVQLLGTHVSANGLAFGPDDATWRGDLFIAEFGNFFGGEPAGRQVVRIPIDSTGQPGAPEPFTTGSSPLDLAFGPAGLYVADFATGTITLHTTPGG